MRKNYFYALMAVALALTACSKDVPEKDKLPSGNTITILANVAPQSRAPQLATDGSGNFSKGDVLSLFVGGNGISTVAIDFAYDSEVLTWGKLGLAENVKQVTFASCYPKQMVGEEGTFEFNSLQTSEADLLLAPAKTVAVGTAEPVSMTFVHALHHLILTFEPGNGYTADDLRELSLTLHAKTTCVVDAAKGSIESVKNITGDYISTGVSASFYLVPQTTDGITLDVRVNGETKRILLDELLRQLGHSQSELEGGKCCSLTLKIGRDSISVSGGSIGAWEDQVTADGEVVIG